LSIDAVDRLGAAGRARQAGGELVVCASERFRTRFAVTGLDRAVTVAAGLAEVLTANPQTRQ